jgi:hypothetical protein
MIEIQIIRRKDGVETSSIRRFEDHHRASKWLIEDSYFQNPDVIKVIWEQHGCRHQWAFQDLTERDLQGFRCRHCGVEFSMEDGLIDEMYRKSA